MKYQGLLHGVLIFFNLGIDKKSYIIYYIDVRRKKETMKEYRVCFDFGSYICEFVSVTAKNKTQVRQIMKNHYGSNVVIRNIYEEN